MASIKIKNLTKSYGKLKALSNVSFEVLEKEFVVLFGPAGAGKTTLLSVISGIADHDEGEILFDNNNIESVPSNKRNVAMVFENYALYPHFTVYDNIAFPLRSPEFKLPEDKIKQSIDSITTKMNINHLLHRYPSQLSNGQRQRVALGRALVRNPNVFLMDEPLAHLDAKLKNSMRTELKAIQQQLDTTTIYVTHDYLEALSLADKIVIINKGTIVQVAKPDDIYYKPTNTFVAKIVGEPEINLYKCQFNDKEIILPNSDLRWSINKKIVDLIKEASTDVTVLAGIRGVDIDVSFEKQRGFYESVITDFHSIGNRFVINALCNNILINTLVPGSSELHVDMKVYVSFREENILFFNSIDENFITRNTNKEKIDG